MCRRRPQLSDRAVTALPWGLVLAVLLLGLGCGREPNSSAAGNVILVIVDTLRADHLGCYGYDRDTSPHIDRFARRSERYENAYAQAPWTLPSVASILTGRWAHGHGARSRLDGKILPIAEDAATLAQWMQQAGYRTGAAINVPFLGPSLGVARGFEHFDFDPGDFSNRKQRDAAATTDAVLRWVDGLGGDRFFLLVHYFDPHLTYDPPSPYDTLFEPDGESAIRVGWGRPEQVHRLRHGQVQPVERQRQSLVARYDGEIRYTDEQFGRLWEALEERGLWDGSLVILTSDHGEEFWDHGGFEHGHTHYREMLRVPLLVKRPGQSAPVVHTELVRSIDIAPTVRRFAGLEPHPDLPGRPLGGEGASHSLAEGSLWSGDLVSIRSEEATLIWNRTTGRQQFFLAHDGTELESTDPAEHPAGRDLLARLRDLPTGDTSRESWEPDPQELEQLRSLGYIK